MKLRGDIVRDALVLGGLVGMAISTYLIYPQLVWGLMGVVFFVLGLTAHFVRAKK